MYVIPVLKHNNLLDNATIYSRTQQSFREHNNRFGNTTVFSRRQGILLMHNNLFQNTITFSDTQTQTKTQQNFKALVTNPDTESDRNLGLALVRGSSEVIFGCCIMNTCDDDTMSPDVDIKVN